MFIYEYSYKCLDINLVLINKQVFFLEFYLFAPLRCSCVKHIIKYTEKNTAPPDLTANQIIHMLL